MKPPRIYTAIVAISRALAKSGVAKTQTNEDDGYAFRGIDEVVQAVAPLLVRHRVCVLPRLSERIANAAVADRHVTVRGAFDFVSAADGSCHTVETFGEAIDQSDKATSKAMTAAYKYALIQAFCIPVRGLLDADRSSPRTVGGGMPDPVQGWAAWTDDIILLIRGCESIDAVQRVQQTYGEELRALASAKRHEFAAIGRAIAERKTALAPKSQGSAADQLTTPTLNDDDATGQRDAA